MEYKKVKSGIFLSRPNRFVAEVMVDGQRQGVHVKNTGRCKELLQEGVRVYLEDHEDALGKRKYRYSLVTVEKKNETNPEKRCRLINIDSQAPNKVVGEALRSGALILPGMDSGFSQIRPESTFGASRFDFYLESETGQKAYAEVKGATLEEEGIVSFPDAPTERGVKHVLELCQAAEAGFLAYVIFVVQMKDVSYVRPNDSTHPAFGESLRQARDKGVCLLAYDCQVTERTLLLNDPVPVKV